MDKLVKASTVDGEETWVVVHVEVQGTHDPDFAQRMFVYYYRLFDRYHRRVASLAVLADERTTWHPDTFRQELWECIEMIKVAAFLLIFGVLWMGGCHTLYNILCSQEKPHIKLSIFIYFAGPIGRIVLGLIAWVLIVIAWMRR